MSSISLSLACSLLVRGRAISLSCCVVRALPSGIPMLPCAAPDVLVYPVYLTLYDIPHPGIGMPWDSMACTNMAWHNDNVQYAQATGRMGTQRERETEQAQTSLQPIPTTTIRVAGLASAAAAQSSSSSLSPSPSPLPYHSTHTLPKHGSGIGDMP
ncbi:hypothetical protein M441DRAFT_315782 [Trichoderma asperellum CBS 433.97]|uniref:Uncharacterized protein n=1 Tax=Trichoderma asperellum (strain ATCC 204424 / CBS 433.97 / NBRC 101777) TaxID=1042311 RepID=A0A2T3ZKN4_TRIA4|nr:hypothetical protein M441DRAFT_315782 [Trichoderma asperellum CBS 433.97]PTB45371.1 hypothetical protein M441DRAFT_315782 [Trichoderma asperellum CBS 433.97]